MKYLRIGMIVATLFLSGIAMATPVKAGDIDCEREPNDVYCTGEEGAGGMRFCDLITRNGVPSTDRFGDCYDRDFSRIDCDELPNHSRCGGTTGRDGLIFCDVAYADLGYKPDCYDRNDNPIEYCDRYAVDESDFVYTARFCQSICDNYEDVIGKEEPCRTQSRTD